VPNEQNDRRMTTQTWTGRRNEVMLAPLTRLKMSV
jgi:hypothetical protein